MNALDFAIVILVIIQAARWAQYGFTRGFFSLVGFWIGLLLGAMALPIILPLIESSSAKLITALFVVFGAAMAVGFLGQFVGHKLFHLLHKVRLNWADGIAGSVFSVAVTLGIVWLVSSMVSGTAFQGMNRQVRDSAIIQTLNQVLPPAPTVLARISGLINPSIFPQVFLGPEPQPVAPVDPPSSADVAAALQSAGRSTVRIESLGCGGQLTGSGFVAADNIVVTNAHVIAGVDRPTVVDINGRYDAQAIYFDPELDIAVLRVNGDLAGPPLNLARNDYPRGTAAITLGYPGGGPLEASPAGVLRSVQARGLDIYGHGSAVRSIYTLQTQVVSGNSGGPVVLPDGTVIGVIFARSQTENDLGYAVRSTEVIPALQQSQLQSQAVNTGVCVSR